MNAIFFGAKRAFQATLRVGRELLAGSGLTPARFDMLSAIDRFPMGPLQSQLRERLGVTRSTISRMVRSLEGLRLVFRQREEGDRRQVGVFITRLGRSLLRRIERSVIRSGAAQLAVDCALVRRTRIGDYWACMLAMDGAEALLRRIRRAFRDEATLHYRWHPDD